MRINTGGRYRWRTDLYDRVGESSRSGAIDASAEFTREMIRNLERVKDYPDLTPDLAEELSTSKVTLTYEVITDLEIDD